MALARLGAPLPLTPPPQSPNPSPSPSPSPNPNPNPNPNPHPNPHPNPNPNPNPNQVVQGVACGYGHTVVLTRGGALFAWGWNRDGQLGVNDTENRHAPVRLGGLPPMLHVACGGGAL